jgi:hypothetical protein
LCCDNYDSNSLSEEQFRQIVRVAGDKAMCLQLLLPANHTALTGDLEVQLIGSLPSNGRLQLLRATAAQSFTAVAAVPVANSSSSVRFPCGVLTLGGRYRVVLLSQVQVSWVDVIRAGS